ncbi:hypothetical protein TI39_contig66g00009 [Zymoseptoria brevis]|uniref:Amine oxidase domain-containing protein n=1 Tax=Zymoseptoria brevis TaxID=1047168 RepID=A0A0F4GY33_9PEZI|nr:hypothetical protein TI39_contig66g00009 [Zymoseptoria brevis]
MTTYTKIFLQFPTTFWPQDTEFFYYADPHERGNYPRLPISLQRSLSRRRQQHPLRNRHSRTIAPHRTPNRRRNPSRAHGRPRRDVPQHHHSRTHGFSLPALDAESGIPGEFSYWPPGVTIREHQNLRANVGRMFFAGEHTEPKFFGYAHGSWYSGREMGERVAGLLGGKCLGSAGEPDDEACGELRHFEVVEGDTPEEDLVTENGWPVESVAMESLERETPFDG